MQPVPRARHQVSNHRRAFVEQDVLLLDVAMNDPVAMCVRQRLCDVAKNAAASTERALDAIAAAERGLEVFMERGGHRRLAP